MAVNLDVIDQNGMIRDRSALPNTNENIWKAGEEKAKEKLAKGDPKGWLDSLVNWSNWINNAVARPQNATEFAMAWAHDMIPSFEFQSTKEKEAEFDDWFEKYLAQSGAGGTGAQLGQPEMMGTPFPDLAGYQPDWKSITEAIKKINAPKYQEQEYDPWDVIATGLSNVNWNAGIVPDFSGATNKMVAMHQAREKNKADVANANAEAEYNAARENLSNQLALENLRAKQAAQDAEIALAKWNAMQPKALGGNKFVWRDGAGNLHWEAVDKGGEARTLGGNEALAALTSMDPKMIKNLTPEKIVQMAKKGSLLLQDKSAQVPWMQGFILQANDMLNASKQEE